VAAPPKATGTAPAVAGGIWRSAAARVDDLAPPRPKYLGLHRELPLLGRLVATLRAADADEDEDDTMALCLGVAEHAHIGADQVEELREGDVRLTVATCAKDFGAAKSTNSSGNRLFVAGLRNSGHRQRPVVRRHRLPAIMESSP
jgi:hypothetical protein